MRLALLLLSAGALIPAAPASARHGFEIGLAADVAPASSEAARTLTRTRMTGATMVRVNVGWSGIAPRQRPPGFDPENPGDPAYAWASLDATVRALVGRGLRAMFNIAVAPTWAEGPDRDPGVRTGAWKPDPAELGAFARAIASRYSGVFPDPLSPSAPLPRVSRFQAWNEPNLATYLAPQWEQRGARFIPASPNHYRRMLNAFYDAVKFVNRSNLVVTAGTAPFGDLEPGGKRMRPVEFWREVFCLQGREALRATPCPDETRFDVLAHHPITFGAPEFTAHHPDNVTPPDMHKLSRVLRRAERAGRAAPAGHKQLWATELWWDSAPPDPDGVPLKRHADWIQEAFYRLWSQGVGAAIWLQLQDSAPSPSYGSTLQSGLFFRNGRPKPAYSAFRFPFVTDGLADSGKGARRARAWGKAPRAGSVQIQRRASDGRWRLLAHPRTQGSGVFTATVVLRRGDRVRAVAGSARSLIWRHRGKLRTRQPQR